MRRGGAEAVVGDPGRVTLHRLNAVEYDNTVRDLFGTSLHPGRELPPDDSGYGFDNNADVLSLSPLHIERYQASAQALVDEALRDGGRALVVTCDPGVVGESACLREVVARFGRRAWRRPLTEDELGELEGFLAVAREWGGGFDDALRMALQALLISQNFVFRVELDAEPASPAPHLLEDHQLAARLSYFLWSSTPDETLLAHADAGRLRDPADLRAEVARMLADPRSRAIADNFAGQWLRARALDVHEVDAQTYPQYRPELRDAFREEAWRYVDTFVHEDLGMERFLTADFTFVNDTLARYYGLPSTGDATFRRVSLAGTPRVGVLTQGAVLTATSHGNRTSPAGRGLWVLSKLLCSAPPPPPPNTPALRGGPSVSGTLRERLEAHRRDAQCAACHQAMDPIGFAFERFDGVGGYRATEAGNPIDVSGRLPTGETFDGPAQLAVILAGDARYARCVTSQMLTYALGRGLNEDDETSVDDIRRGWSAGGMRLRDLVERVVLSDPFRKRRGEPTLPGGAQ